MISSEVMANLYPYTPICARQQVSAIPSVSLLWHETSFACDCMMAKMIKDSSLDTLHMGNLKKCQSILSLPGTLVGQGGALSLQIG